MEKIVVLYDQQRETTLCPLQCSRGFGYSPGTQSSTKVWPTRIKLADPRPRPRSGTFLWEMVTACRSRWRSPVKNVNWGDKFLHLSSILPTAGDRSWYAAYTQPRHEKAVAQQLEFKGVEVFCPTFPLESKWKDRTVRIAAPLFPGYVFTRICSSQRALVLSAPGVIRILSANGRPVPIPPAEIEAVRLCLAETTRLERHSIVEGGTRVRVRSGPFLGLEGTVVRQNETCKVLVSIAAIHQAVALELDCDCLEPVPNLDPLKVA